MERFFDRTDQENSKTQRRKGTHQPKFKKRRRKEWRKKKEEIFTQVEALILVCSPPSVGKALGATALVRPSLRRTHSNGNLPYNINVVSLDEIRVLKPKFMIFWAKYSPQEAG
jgi:hypothetical protein